MSKTQTPSLGKTFGLVALLSVISKVIGLVRDVVVASAYGTTFLADSYNYAYLFTGNILILFGGLGGPFHSATVTTLTPRRDKSEFGTLAGQIIVLTTLFLALAMLIIFLIAPYLVHLVGHDYGKSLGDRLKFYSETILQLRVMSPLIVIAGLIGISYGILNIYHKVLWPSLSPALASCAIIIALLLFPNHDSSLPLAIGTLVGAICQLIAQIPDLFRCGIKYGLSKKPVDGLRNFTSVLWPALFGTSVGQLVIYVDSFFCASIGEGAWTAIANANRLVQLPLGVLITAMLVPVLPRFTEQAASQQIDNLKQEFRRSLSFLSFLAAPLTAVFLVLPGPIIKLLFQRGAFNQHSTFMVTLALFYLVPSLLFYIGRDLITRVFYALQDSKTPYYVAVMAIFIKAFLDWIFVILYPMGVGGISLATSLITVFNLSILTVLLQRKLGSLGLHNLISPLALMALASLVGGFVTACVFNWVESILPMAGPFFLAFKILVASLSGLLVYFLICLICQLNDAHMLLRRLVRRY